MICYGIEIPEHEGRAGMVAIQRLGGRNMIDVNQLSKHVNENLPKYARPLFLRIINQPQNWDLLTSTLKLRKVDLQR